MAENNLLTKDDLVLLMESYKNMISMHQTILEQSNRTIDSLSEIVNRQESISVKQQSTCGILNDVSKKLDICAEKLDITRTKVDSLQSTIKEKITEHDINSLKSHEKISTKIQIGWIGMGTIILAILSLVIAILHVFTVPPVP